ncbi:MAG: alpha/beta fold hydrolase [Clostridia bacterium]|nr:alpha/beta fold hydrolase [Clostridia bacterium]
MRKNKKTRSLKNTKRIVALIAILTGLSSGTIFAAKEIYDSCFDRYDKKELYTIYGEFDYSRVSYKLDRQLFNFYSSQVKLQGYFYPSENSKGVVVVSHGMHAGADDYLPIIEYLVKNNYSVFTYDCKGTYNSDGDSTIGMITPLVDLDNALNFIESDSYLSKQPLFLLGHSWGGYAVTSVLSIHKNINACAAIAPFNSGYTLIYEKGEQYAGPLVGGMPKVFLDIYQKILFKNYTKYNAVKGINSTNIPVLIAHGEKDSIIDFNRQAVIAHRNKLRLENVFYYVGKDENAGHNTIMHSKEAVRYQKEIASKLAELKEQKGKSLSDDDLKEFCNNVNHSLYSEVNEELMYQIIDMFNKTI